MKKIFLFLFAFILLAGMVNAAAVVEHGFYDKDNAPLNQVTGIVLVCQDNGCNSVTTPKTFDAAYSSGNGNVITISYPQVSEGAYGYAAYFYKFGYLPLELPVDVYGDQEIQDTNTLLKKENCLVSVNDVAISNFEKDKQAVIIAEEITNNLERKQVVGYRPTDFNAYYGLNANIILNVMKDGSLIHTESKNILSLMNSKDELSFNYNVKDYGKYDIEVTTMTDDVKCTSSSSDKDVKSVELKAPNQAPVAKINPVANVKVGQQVDFDASGSTDDKSIVRYEWDFGDNSNKGEGVKVLHAYNIEGTYNVKLNVYDAEGATNTANVNVAVEKIVTPPVTPPVNPPVTQNTAPVVVWLVGTQESNTANSNVLGAKVNEIVYFDGELSYDDKSIVSYSWDFGDNLKSSDVLGFHSYSKEGGYNIVLVVKDAEGLEGRKQIAINIAGIAPPVVNAEFNVVEENLNVNVIRGSKTTQEITIQNKANVDVSGFTASLKLNETIDGRIDAKLLSGIAKANADSKFTLEISATDDVDIDGYSVVITILRGDKQDMINVNIKVQPDICEATADKSKFRITIKEPKKGKDFKPGQKMPIEVDVKNIAGKDLDVGVEAELWNVKTGNVLASVDGDAMEIEKNDKETFEMELEVPSNDDVNEKDDMILYVRAFEDGDEDKICSYESKELDVKREDYDIEITDFVVMPSSLTCSQSQASFRVGLENIGKRKDDSVAINVRNDELGLQLSEGPFTLKEFDESDNSVVKGLSFTLPRNVVGKTYDVTLDVLFNDGKNKNTKVKQLVIPDCTGRAKVDAALLGLLQEEETESNERVVQPATLFGGLFGGDSMTNWAFVLGIILVSVIIIYMAKVLARS